MIHENDAISLLLEACPSFQSDWDQYQQEEAGEERLVYLEFAAFAEHLLELYQQGDTESFPTVFAVVERLHQEGTPFLREAACIGLLETLQNTAGNRGINHDDAFLSFLYPACRDCWLSLDRFWGASASHEIGIE